MYDRIPSMRRVIGRENGAVNQVSVVDDEESHTVMMYPDYTGSNSYQRKLRQGLADCGYEVEMVETDRLLPLVGAVYDCGRPAVFHIHWLHRHFVADSRLLTALLGVRLLLELLVLRALSVPVVWTVHNLSDHENRSPRTERATRHGAARLCDQLIVHCESARESVVGAYGLPEAVAERIEVVPHGHYIDSYRNDVSRRAARDQFGYDDDRTLFVYFGLIRPYKNVSDLIRTFREIDNEEARLLIVGNPWNDEMERRIRRLAARDDRVDTVLEFVPDEDIQLYMNAADVTVFPFEEVLTSGTTLLAMSFGRAVIAPRAGCVSELVGESGGVTYDPDDADGLHRAMKAALDADLDAMGEHNLEIVSTFDWASIGCRTARVYGRARSKAGNESLTSLRSR